MSLGKREFVILELSEKIPFQFGKGVVRATQCERVDPHTFLDYILNGLEMSLIIAVDFTGSNGDASSPSSLHYIDLRNFIHKMTLNVEKNQYLQAITSVGQILENYDSDKKFSLLGFGALVPNYMPEVSPCFAVNGNIFNPEVNTLQGVLESIYNFITPSYSIQEGIK